MAYKEKSPISVAEGGTGAITLTSNGVLLGNTTSAITATSAGTTGQVLAGNTGSAPTFQAASGISLGTTNHAVQIGNASGTLTSLGVAATGATLMGSTGADPAFTGSPSFSGSVTAGTTITATSGAITATSGNFVSTAATSSSVGNLQIGGSTVLHTFGSANVFLAGVGTSSGNYTLTANEVTCIGSGTGSSITSASNTTALGYQAGNAVTSASSGTYIGSQAGLRLTTGNYNVLIGAQAGSNYTGSEANNICIGTTVAGTASESNVLRIGTGTGSGLGNIATAIISGISGATSASGVAVLVNTSNVLGTTTSSVRYKEKISPITCESEKIHKLRPVTFHYKKNMHVNEEDAALKQYGLIAEEVNEIIPDLVMWNQKGEIESVRYHFLIPLLLKEIQNLRKELDEIKRSL